MSYTFAARNSPLQLTMDLVRYVTSWFRNTLFPTNIHFLNHYLLSTAEQIAVFIIVFHSIMRTAFKMTALQGILMSDSK